MESQNKPGIFRLLDPEEEADFRAWADNPENQTKEIWDQYAIVHPVIRDQWEKNGFAAKMQQGTS